MIIGGVDRMTLIIESVILCLIFTVMVYIMSRKPIKTLYNYPPKIQERVKNLKEYKDKIPTQENKIIAKIFAAISFLIILFSSGDNYTFLFIKDNKILR